MRSAYPGSYGYGSYGNETDRLSNLRRAIESIEQRLATPPTPPYAQQQMPPASAPHGMGGGYGFGAAPDQHPNPAFGVQGYASGERSELGLLQAQLNQLAGQIGMAQGIAPNSNHLPGGGQPGSATSEILNRQKILNGAAPAQPAPVDPMSATLEKQFEELKNELAGIKNQVAKPIAVKQDVPQEEIDRIASAIAELQTQNNPNEQSFDRLTRELDQLRKSMRNDVKSAVSVVRSELTKTSDPKVDQLAERMEAISQGIDQVSLQSANDMTPRVDRLAKQLDDLRMTVDDLPQTLAISRLEDRLSEIAEKVEVIGEKEQQQPSVSEGDGGISPQQMESLEGRLDEIARALVAVSNANSKAKVEEPIDLSAIDRVEARMADLARTIDSLAQQDQTDDLANIAVRIDGLTDRLGSFEKYAESGDLGGANAMFAAPDTGMIEEQLRQLNAQIEEASARSQTGTLEEQIRHLTMRVEEAANVNSTAAQMSNLEAQIGQIIRHLNKRDSAVAPDFAPVEARLGQIENQLINNQNFSLEAAQQAAQQAVSLMGPQSESGQIIDALSQDLKALQLVAEGGNANNVETFQQVQSTLQQVVERLGTIEGAIEDVATRPATIVTQPSASMPAAAGLHAAPGIDQHAHDNAMEQMANQANFAADGLMEAATETTPGPIQQAAIDSGFTVNPSISPEPTTNRVVDAPNLDPTDHLEANPGGGDFDNTPLEPGSAAPDLDQLVQQAAARLDATKATLSSSETPNVVGDERQSDDVRPDAVAAARRALQATTAEMNAVREEVSESKSASAVGGLKGKIQSLVPNFDGSKLRKPLVFGAAALLLAIIAFKGIGMIGGDNGTSVANLDNPSIETVDNKSVDEIGNAERVVRDVESVNADNAQDEIAANLETSSETSVSVDGQPQQDNASPQDASLPATILPNENTPAVDGESQQENAALESGTDDQGETSSQGAYDVPASAGPAALVAAASSGDPKALFQLGMRYSDGDDVKRNMTESAKWFQLSAETGFAPAQYSLGSLYEKGIGVERDVNKAADWYEKAAAQGNARAMHNLAVIHAMGNPPSIQPNMDNAVGWFQKAAAFGIKDSQFNLGILYGQGMGVPQNLGESYKWFALAAKTGDTDAGKKRDEVANAMDPNDLDDARREVNNWVPKKLKEAANRVAVPEEWRGKATKAKATSSTISNASAETAVNSTSDIKLAQNLLNQRGFDVGTPDGLIGPKTKRAIMEFQRSAGIPITGNVDGKLLKALDLQT